MELRQLEEYIRTLATVEETESPLISCYRDVMNGAIDYRDDLEGRLQILRKSVPARSALEFDEAAANVAARLHRPVPPRTRGIAAFARGGEKPFWLSLQFEVPLPNWIAVGSTPSIYHLMELKDNYDRYAILLTTETSAGIIGVNLGSVTTQLWQSRPELRRQVGHEWTKEHFRDYRREKTQQFIHDQIRGLDQLISTGGYGHLMLAGSAHMIAAVRKLLPKRLAEKLVDSVPARCTDHPSDVVASTLKAFLEHEEQDSQVVTQRLISQIRTHGLAVTGTRAAMEAIRARQADVLVVVKTYKPGIGWECRGCGKLELDAPGPNRCPVCLAARWKEFDVREELARTAEQHRVAVEVVEHNDALMSMGGVGCLLRFLKPGSYLYPAA